MAKYKCPWCGVIAYRDLRLSYYKRMKGTAKYRSFCGTSKKMVFMMKQK